MRSVGSVNARMPRLTAVDAQTYWMSAKIPNDQFLLYGFDGAPADLPRALAEVRARAASCPELTVRIDDAHVGYPRWVPRDVDADQIIVHDLDDASWAGCLAAVAALDQLDAQVAPWRLHVFTPVAEVPGARDAGTVAVLQMAHTLGDGIRSSALAARLFGRDITIPSGPAPSASTGLALPWRSVRAARAHRQLVRDTAAGRVPPQAASRPARHTNRAPTGPASVRTLIRRRAQLRGPTVTVAVLSAVAEALAGHLGELGEGATDLGAEVPMANVGARQDNNHFGNVGVGLYPQLDPDARLDRIAADLADRRRRGRHPAMRASAVAFAAVPAPLLRWGVAQFDPQVRSPTVTGNTVVSSVHRGPADLRFGDTTVTVTAGYPALSPMMGLTHGVHGIGDTIAVSVHAAAAAIGDIDGYLDRLGSALD